MTKREEVVAILRQYKLGSPEHEIVIPDAALELVASRIVSLFEHGHHVMTPPSIASGIKS